MAVCMRMNELWKRTALSLMFCLLLIHSCQGQESTTTDPLTQSTAEGFTTEAPQTANTEQPNTTEADTSAITKNDDFQSGSTPPPSDTPAESTHISPTVSQTPPPKNVAAPQFTDSLEMKEEHKKQSTLSEENASGSEEGREGDASGSSAVFVSVLVTGLLLAALIIGLYYFKCHRRPKAKGLKLAEETFVADEENQGNTLVSVAPLNQPEPQEKPSLNGESPEGVKNQTPPAATNGHSTTKTADSEM